MVASLVFIAFAFIGRIALADPRCCSLSCSANDTTGACRITIRFDDWICTQNPVWLLDFGCGCCCRRDLGGVCGLSCNAALAMCRLSRDHRQVVTAGGRGLLGTIGHSCRGGVPSVGVTLQKSVGFQLIVQVRAGWPAWRS